MIWRVELQQAMNELERCRVQSDFVSLIRFCSRMKLIDEGRHLHSIAARDGSERETFIGNLLVEMYSSCGSMGEACSAFDSIARRNVYSWSIVIGAFALNGDLQMARRLLGIMPETNFVAWNTIIGAYIREDQVLSAQELFYLMPERDVVSWNSMILAYSRNGEDLRAVHLFLELDREGIQPSRVTFLNVLDSFSEAHDLRHLHREISELGLHKDLVLGTSLVRLYGDCSSPEESKAAFDEIVERNIVSWNTLAYSYSKNSCKVDELFELIPQLDVVSWSIMMTAFAAEGNTLQARKIFDEMPERSLWAWGAMLGAYLEEENTRELRILFDLMPEHDVVCWTTLLAAYARSGDSKEAHKLFGAMNLEGIQGNRVTYLSLIESCETLAEARAVHSIVAERGFEGDPIIRTSLIGMYGRCRSPDEARWILLRNPSSGGFNLVNWTALLTAYVDNSCNEDAFKLFQQMAAEGIEADRSTLVTMFDGCSTLVRLKLIHSSIDPKLELDIIVGTSLLNMYGKFGNVEMARKLFDKIPDKNLVCWTALVAAYAQNGLGKSAVEVFQAAGLDGLQPDIITFSKILVACSHSGLINQGCHFFKSFVEDYHLPPLLDHYNSLIDLFSRTGMMEEAQEIASTMPFQPTQVSQMTLLSGFALNPG